MTQQLVFGGTGGIGSEVVRLLAEQGTPVFFTYVHADDASEALQRELGEHVRGIKIEPGTVAWSNMGECIDLDVPISSLVYAGGPTVEQQYLSATSPTALGSAVNNEISGTFEVVSQFLPQLRSSQTSVVIVTTAATNRYVIRDGLSAIPKAAIEQMVRAFAAEEGRYGVRFNAVGPGMLSDGMARRLIEQGFYSNEALETARNNIALNRFGSALEVARVVAFLASDASSYVTGQILNVDGGYTV